MRGFYFGNCSGAFPRPNREIGTASSRTSSLLPRLGSTDMSEFNFYPMCSFTLHRTAAGGGVAVLNHEEKVLAFASREPGTRNDDDAVCPVLSRYHRYQVLRARRKRLWRPDHQHPITSSRKCALKEESGSEIRGTMIDECEALHGFQSHAEVSQPRCCRMLLRRNPLPGSRTKSSKIAFFN